jgi:hypothetical protein
VAGAVWGSVITAAITATATLTGVHLTQRHAAALRRLDRRDERRKEQRAVIANVLLTGHEWERLAEGVKLAAGLAPPKTPVSDEVFKLYFEGGATHARFCWIARLTVPDESVMRHLDLLVEAGEALDEVIRLLGSGAIASRAEAVADAEAKQVAYLKTLWGLEKWARERLLDDP